MVGDIEFGQYINWLSRRITQKSLAEIFSADIVCVLLNCQIADRHFLEFSYLRMLKS